MNTATRWMLAIFLALAAAVLGLFALARASGQGVQEPAPEVVLAAGAPAGSTEGVIVAGAGVQPPAESHAWFVVPDSRGQGLVLHVPPRRYARPEDGKLHGSEDGTLRIASRLDRMPSAIAAWGDRVYLLEDRPEGFESTKRLVSSLRAVRSGVGDLWVTYPSAGIDSHPSLTGEGELLSFVGTSLGPVVLLEARDPATGRRVLRVRMLVDRSWVDIGVPAEASAMMYEGTHRRGEARPWAMLASSLEGLRLVCGVSEGLVGWTVACDREFAVRVRQSSEAEGDAAEGVEGAGDPAGARVAGEEPAPIDVSWSPRETLGEVGFSGQSGATSRPAYAGVVGGRLVLVEEAGPLLRVWEWSEAGWRELNSFSLEGGVGALGVASLDGVGRLALAWPEASEESGSGAGVPKELANREVRHQMLEVSVFTGREMFSGRWKFVSPLAASDLRLLSFALIGAMSLVIVFVLKAESTGVEAVLPPHASYAGPVMRSCASAIDFSLALVIAGRVFSLGFGEIFSIEAMLNGQGVWAILTALGVAAVLGSVCEATFGRTLGKLITGCEVVDSRAVALPGPALDGVERDTRPPALAAILRNTLKWMLPPIGLMVLMDAQGRHPADRLSKTAVVVWLDEEQE